MVDQKRYSGENNLPMPTTLEELKDVALKLKELYPESTPISNRFYTNNIMAGIAGAYNTIAGWTLGDGMFYDESRIIGCLLLQLITGNSLLLMRENCMHQDALDPEFSTQDSSVYEQRIAKGEIFIVYDWATNCKLFNQEGKAFDENFNMVAMAPPEGLENEYALQWNGPWEQAWVLPATVAEQDNFEAILRMIDWLYSDEAMVAMTFGEEGTTYKVEDGRKVSG